MSSIAFCSLDRDLNVAVALRGTLAEETTQSSRTFGTVLDGRWQQAWTPVLRSSVLVQARLEAGLSQSAFTHPYAPAQTLRLREAALTVSPTPWMDLKGGALFQNVWDAPLIVWDQTALGASERFTLYKGLFLEAQQAIPSDGSSFAVPGDVPSVPVLLLERVRAELPLSAGLMSEIYAGHYFYSALSTECARQSRFLGSTILGMGPKASGFAYGFQGAFAGVALRTRNEEGLRPFVKIGWARNFEVDDRSHDSLLLQVGSAIPIDARWVLHASGAYFRNGTDVVPGLYARRDWGHGNRQGAEFRLGVDIHRSFQIDASYARAYSLVANPYQSDLHLFSLQIGTAYAFL